MEHLFGKNDISVMEKIYLGFGLGKAFEDLKLYDKASQFLLAANPLNLSLYIYSFPNKKFRFDQMKAVFTLDFPPLLPLFIKIAAIQMKHLFL
jgi:hypothetical protein